MSTSSSGTLRPQIHWIVEGGKVSLAAYQGSRYLKEKEVEKRGKETLVEKACKKIGAKLQDPDFRIKAALHLARPSERLSVLSPTTATSQLDYAEYIKAAPTGTHAEFALYSEAGKAIFDALITSRTITATFVPNIEEFWANVESCQGWKQTVEVDVQGEFQTLLGSVDIALPANATLRRSTNTSSEKGTPHFWFHLGASTAKGMYEFRLSCHVDVSNQPQGETRSARRDRRKKVKTQAETIWTGLKRNVDSFSEEAIYTALINNHPPPSTPGTLQSDKSLNPPKVVWELLCNSLPTSGTGAFSSLDQMDAIAEAYLDSAEPRHPLTHPLREHLDFRPHPRETPSANSANLPPQ